MTKEELKDFCELLMCTDPDPTATPGCLERMTAFANKQAQAHGFTDWVEAYHKL
jgi:hypothetical protein